MAASNEMQMVLSHDNCTN